MLADAREDELRNDGRLAERFRRDSRDGETEVGGRRRGDDARQPRPGADEDRRDGDDGEVRHGATDRDDDAGRRRADEVERADRDVVLPGRRERVVRARLHRRVADGGAVWQRPLEVDAAAAGDRRDELDGRRDRDERRARA